MKLVSASVIVLVAVFSVACSQTQKTTEKDKKTESTALKETKKSSDLSYACLVGKDVRLVEVEKTTARCEVHYTKFGEKRQVAWAEATPQICSRVKKQIRENIESKGFKCDADVASLKSSRTTASN